LKQGVIIIAKHGFSFPMRKYERAIGLLYIPVHAVLLIYAVEYVLRLLNLRLNSAQVNLVCYAVSALFLLCMLGRYWRATLGDVAKAPVRALQAVILGYAFYFFADWGMGYLIALFTSNAVNPNSRAVIEEIRLDGSVMLVVAVLLAPIAEETMFRGALFGTLRTKSRALAYAVSALAFAAYHIWTYIILGNNAAMSVYLLQYIPAALALAWSYEWSGTLVAPTLLHALMNLVTTINIQTR
jgi:membrane protease YdiL (CAAX protease family)